MTCCVYLNLIAIVVNYINIAYNSVMCKSSSWLNQSCTLTILSPVHIGYYSATMGQGFKGGFQVNLGQLIAIPVFLGILSV